MGETKEGYIKRRETYIRRATVWNKNNKDRRKWLVLKSRHNLSKEEYENQLLIQNGLCAGCEEPPKDNTRFHVDHDHSCCPSSQKTCGKCFRGLLCGNCNRLIGLAKENPDTLLRLINYLNGTRNQKFEGFDFYR